MCLNVIRYIRCYVSQNKFSEVKEIENKCLYNESRVISRSALYKLCIRKHWLDECSDDSEYDEFFSMVDDLFVVLPYELSALASYIKNHTATYSEIEDIMALIVSNCCRSSFYTAPAACD